MDPVWRYELKPTFFKKITLKMWRLFMILMVFVSSLAWLLFLVSQAPHFLPKANNTQSDSAVLYFPTNLEEVKFLTEKISQITETDLGMYQFRSRCWFQGWKYYLIGVDGWWMDGWMNELTSFDKVMKMIYFFPFQGICMSWHSSLAAFCSSRRLPSQGVCSWTYWQVKYLGLKEDYQWFVF